MEQKTDEDPRLLVLKTAAKKLNEAVMTEYKNVERALSSLTKNQQEKIDRLQSEEKKLTKEHEAFLKKHSALHQEAMEQINADRIQLEAEKESLKDVQTFSNRITLNVGGTKFSTTRATLTSVPSSMIGAMFSGRHKLIAEEDGSFFIDRDGRHFHHILNYLRNGVIAVNLESEVALELAAEAEYFGMLELAKVLRMPKLNIDQYLGEEIVRMRAVETKLREPLGVEKLTTNTSNAATNNASSIDSHKGLVSIFEDDGVLQQMNSKHVNDPMNFSKLLSKYSAIEASEAAADLPSTVADMASFRRNFNKEYASVRHGLLERLTPILSTGKILIAGGAVLRCLTVSTGVSTNTSNPTDFGKTRRGDLLGKRGDIDIFICTQDPVEATQISSDIFHAITQDRDDCRVIRGKGVINIDIGQLIDWDDFYDEDMKNTSCLTVQIVLRLYESPAEVLLGFDCDCCCFGYDGTHVWGLPRAIRAIQYGTNILNPLHSWPSKASYEYRLVKYALRGYSISVPGLETVSLDTVTIVNTPLSQLKGFARLVRLVLAYEGYSTQRNDPEGLLFIPSAAPSYWNYTSENVCAKADSRGGAFTSARVQDLHETLKAALGEFEVSRLAASTWFYNDEGMMDIRVPKKWLDRMEAKKTLIYATSWDLIHQCNDSTLQIPNMLEQAWDSMKRSREYLNAQENDLDARYFAHASSDYKMMPIQTITK